MEELVKAEEVPPSVFEECKYLIVLLLQNNYDDRLEARVIIRKWLIQVVI